MAASLRGGCRNTWRWNNPVVAVLGMAFGQDGRIRSAIAIRRAFGLKPLAMEVGVSQLFNDAR
jgi:hypothetical protein